MTLPTDETRELPQAGQVWRHYLGTLYRVVGLGICNTTGHTVVSVRPLDGGWLLVVELRDWSMMLTLPNDAGRVPHFVRVEVAEPADPADVKPAGLPVEQRGPEY